MKVLAAITLAVGLAACSADQPSAPRALDLTPANDVRAAQVYTYEVTITNLTTGQPMSPGILVTHGPRVSLFKMGSIASAGITDIAENGSPATAFSMLSGAPGTYDAVTTAAPAHRIGGPGPSSVMATITSDAEHRLISAAVMLICTNDGFAGVHDFALPTDDNPVTVYAYAYDAGTERNSERDGDIVPPCFGIGPTSGTGGGGHMAEQRRVRAHPGINGDRDLSPSLHAWSGAVAMISIQRSSLAP
ncbi:MAG: spondin domain-containing protein [Gemmatimonadaceae bacterium]